MTTKMRYFYLRQKKGRAPRGVVAMEYSEGLGIVTVAASLCAPGDEWDRQAGVNKAVGRLRATNLSERSERKGHFENVTFPLDLPESLNRALRLLGIPAHKHEVDIESASKLYETQLMLFDR